jgi:rRNA processing protein Krr1/Pno1
MAKQAGYFKKKKNATLAEKMEMTRRAAEVGKQIHLANVERGLRANEERLQEMEKERIAKLIAAGHAPEEALRIFQEENNRNNS